jgi:hypothetical protein
MNPVVLSPSRKAGSSFSDPAATVLRTNPTTGSPSFLAYATDDNVAAERLPNMKFRRFIVVADKQKTSYLPVLDLREGLMDCACCTHVVAAMGRERRF